MIYIAKSNKPDIEQLPFELVERKGIGHPDTLCDAIAEKASVYYSRYFYENFGGIAHHWFDKVMLIGGRSLFQFGKGDIITPYKVIFAGKAAKTYGNNIIPLDDILKLAVNDVLSSSLTGFDISRHVEIVNEIVDYHGAGRKNSRYQPKDKNDLVSFNHKQLVSNDCNLLSGYAPYSRLEQLVLVTEQFINGSQFKKEHPETGWDVKIVGSREFNNFNLLINLPFLAANVNDEQDYFYKKNLILRYLKEFINSKFNFPVNLTINPQDENKHYYITVLGSVADTGDVGVVGRGNRINGLITPMRSMSIEAPAGKNPIDHTGKLYGILTHKLSHSIHQHIQKPVEIHIFTSKESPLNSPDHVSIQITDWEENGTEKEIVHNLVRESFDNIYQISKDLIIKGEVMW